MKQAKRENECERGEKLRKKIIGQIKEKKIIAIVRGVYGDDCRKLTEALQEGGIGLIEFTFDQKTPDDWKRTCENISMVCREYGSEMTCGAGTVLMEEQVRLTKNAGGAFIISPNVNRRVIEETVRQGMVSIPGALSPSEITDAAEYGADFVKIFPAASLGAGYLKAVKGPLNHIPLLAVGGVNELNAAEFLRAGAEGVGIGGNLVNREWIAAGEFDKIREAARRTVQNCRGEFTV